MKKAVILHSDVPPNAGEDELDCLRQADTIAEALRKLGYDPVLLPFVLDLNQTIQALQTIQPEFVFNLVETINGKGSLIHFAPSILDYLNIPYTGCGTDAMFLTSNKPLTKEMMQSAGIATPAWISSRGISSGVAPSSTYLLKASWEDASVGLDENSIFQLTDTTDVITLINDRKKRIGSPCFAEAYIDGREFNMALIAGKSGVRALPPAEMQFIGFAPGKLKLLDYNAKWVEGTFEYENTARTMDFSPEDDQLISDLQDIAQRCWNLFGLRGYARVDFRIDKNGQPWVLEINANPCLSLEAGFAFAVERAGLQYYEAIDLIVQDALRCS
ncbi:MAG: D-alanine--D-alanine ligase [Deltaproteobacteria bacterium HGW-Deltaproteobacteria-10]|nr:MAG: D-alanine--D-alanine ligase [Deltaproteobacteria bacterium HGW-Deltaproteobacteria-10]